MKRLCIFVTLMASLSAFAAELTIKDLIVPQLDGAGRMIRRLKADSAIGPLEKPRLSNGVVEFFLPQDPNHGKQASLFFLEATYHRSAEMIEGDGQISLISTKGDLSGKGFQYQLISGKLILKSSVIIDLPTAHITGK